MRRSLIGVAAALASMAILTGAMLPLRSQLSIATTALILIVPVVVGVIVGGFAAGAMSVIVGFLVYDFFFIPPYLTLQVGAAENWAALGVYAAVMLPVARVVAGMNTARAEARRQGAEIRKLFEVSHLLVEDQPLDALLATIVTMLAELFDSRQVALFLPGWWGGLELVAAAGEPLSEEQLRRIVPAPGTLASLETQSSLSGDLLTLALTATGRPIGLLALAGEAVTRHEREPLLVFVDQIALAVERAQLREEALQKRVNEEMARLAKTLVTAVSHDLRAPLSAMKASSSVLADPELDLDAATRHNLAAVIDNQTDRLAALVQNLLDMSRIQRGVLTPRRSVVSLHDLVATVLADLDFGAQQDIKVDVPDDLPPIDIDPVLIARVIANLLGNASRYNPPGEPIMIHASPAPDGTVEVSVSDHGPGVSPSRRNEVFQLFARRSDDAGAGLGLTIAKTFVEAHQQRIWIEDVAGGGARFCFTLPVAATIPAEAPRAEHTHR